LYDFSLPQRQKSWEAGRLGGWKAKEDRRLLAFWPPNFLTSQPLYLGVWWHGKDIAVKSTK